MKQKKHYYSIFLLLIFIFGCSKEENELNNNESNVELNLNSISSNSYSIKLDYNYSSKIENIKLIWNTTDEVDLINKIGEINIITNNSDITVNNLEQNQNYYFKLSGNYNNDIVYSNIISLKTSEIKLLINDKLLNYQTGGIVDVVKTNDGYLVFTPKGSSILSDKIEITKLNFDLNHQWTILINESTESSDYFKGLISLNNDEYIGIGQKHYHSGAGVWGNSIYSFKFNGKGTIINKSNLSTDYSDISSLTDLKNYLYSMPKFSNNHNHLKVIVSSDSTYYNSNDNHYYKELELYNNGELKSKKVIGSFDDLSILWYLRYDNIGNIYNYGNIDIRPNDGLQTWDAWLQKYDSNNSLVWNNNYGIYGGDDSADNILIDNNETVIIGKNGHQNGFDGESKWIIKTNSSGEIIWDFKETRDDFIYQGKDIIKDVDGNYISLFFDIYYPNSHVYNIVSVIKTDIEGNVIWKYYDGEDFNDDRFQPSKIFVSSDNEYTIFGDKEGYLWVKKIKIE